MLLFLVCWMFVFNKCFCLSFLHQKYKNIKTFQTFCLGGCVDKFNYTIPLMTCGEIEPFFYKDVENDEEIFIASIFVIKNLLTCKLHYIVLCFMFEQKDINSLNTFNVCLLIIFH